MTLFYILKHVFSSRDCRLSPLPPAPALCALPPARTRNELSIFVPCRTALLWVPRVPRDSRGSAGLYFKAQKITWNKRFKTGATDSVQRKTKMSPTIEQRSDVQNAKPRRTQLKLAGFFSFFKAKEAQVRVASVKPDKE